MNKSDLITAFREIGITEGMTLEVHSSLSSFGHVEGGAETVIEALMECVGGSGSIFMPALRLGPPLELTDHDKRLGLTVKIKVLPEDAPRTDMGIIADTFRKRADVVMGEGIIRTAGWGAHAEEAARGGLDYAIHNGGKARLLGVDIYKLTSMHYMEDVLPKEISDIFAPNAEASAIYPPDEWFIETGEPPVKPWYTIQDIAFRKGLIKAGIIGECRYMFFDILNVVGIYREELLRAPFKLYGLEKG